MDRHRRLHRTGCGRLLSLGAWQWLQLGGKSFFDLLDFVTANIMLPAGGFFICIFTGWVLDRRFMPAELTNQARCACTSGRCSACCCAGFVRW